MKVDPRKAAWCPKCYRYLEDWEIVDSKVRCPYCKSDLYNEKPKKEM